MGQARSVLRPACLDDPAVRCQFDSETGECRCMDVGEPDPPRRPTEDVPTGEYL